jgi:hypothetical protein
MRDILQFAKKEVADAFGRVGMIRGIVLIKSRYRKEFGMRRGRIEDPHRKGGG